MEKPSKSEEGSPKKLTKWQKDALYLAEQMKPVFKALAEYDRTGKKKRWPKAK